MSRRSALLLLLALFFLVAFSYHARHAYASIDALRQGTDGGAFEWSIRLVLQVLMPLLCLGLGFWVAGLRPLDPLAWLLLALLVSFGLIAVDHSIPAASPPLRDLELVYQTLCGTSWPIWMMLFGVYFPERLVFDRRWPWAKWILLVSMTTLILADLMLQMAGAHALALAEPLGRLMAPLERPRQILGMLCISIFFMGLGTKSGMMSAPDARRRLGLLWTGASVGLTPMFLVALTSLIRGTPMFEGVPHGVTIAALLMLNLFPLTLAYVIVVHRALDVRVVIRQGIRYAFARRGVQVLRAVLVFCILLAISAVASRPNTRQVDILRILGIGGTAIVLIGVVGERVIRWTDRRFFREALDAERILNDLSEKVLTMVEAAPLLETVTTTISDSLHVSEVAVFLVEGTACVPVHAVGYASAPEARFLADGPVLRRLGEDRGPVRVNLDDPRGWIADESPAAREEREALRRLHTQMLLPLAVKERVTGFVSLGPKRSEEPYSATDARLLQSVTTQAALALENSRLAAAMASEVAKRERLNREVEIAREVQERLFPQTFPPIDGLDYSGRCRPALGVGGDYYDFIRLPDGRFGIAIADVSGKGIGAALLMASLQASLRGQTIQPGEIAHLIGNVNRLVYEASPDNRYATFFYGQYDPATRSFAFVNAGHCPPILLRNEGRPEVIRLRASGTVVGLFKDSVYKEGTIALRSGDILVAYTDGISEAQNRDDEEWGEERLIAAAGRCDGLTAAESIARLMKETDAFVAGADQYDDMTLVVVKVV